MPFKTFIRIVAVAIALGGVFFDLMAQEADTKPMRGFMPNMDQLSSSIENIDIATGKLNLRIPLADLPPGRGGIGYGATLSYESNLYDLAPAKETVCKNNQCGLFEYARIAAVSNGWNHNFYSYRIESETQLKECPGCPDGGVLRYKYRVILPDSSSHVLYLSGYESMDEFGSGFYGLSMSGTSDWCSSQYNGWPASYTGWLTYYTNDGSFLKYETYANPNNSTPPADSGSRLYYPDGRVVVTIDGALREYDANGNYIQFEYMLAGDQNSPFGGAAYVKISNESGQAIYMVFGIEEADGGWRRDAIVAEGPNGPVYYYLDYYPRQITAGGWTYETGTPPEFYSDHPSRTASINFIISMLSYLHLPLEEPPQLGEAPSSFHTHYEFDYWTTEPGAVGWLKSMQMPSGALYSYQYGYRGAGSQPATLAKGAYVSHKNVSNGSQEQGLDWSFLNTADTTEITNPDGGKIIYRYIHKDVPSWNASLVNEIEERDHNGVLNRKRTREWAQKAVPALAGRLYAPNNPWMTKETVFAIDSNGNPTKCASTVFAQDFNGNLLSKTEHDWTSCGSGPGYAVRTMQYDYYLQNSYYWQPHDTNLFVAKGSRRLNAVRRITTFAGTTPKAATEFVYDSPYSKGNVIYKMNWDNLKASNLPSIGSLSSANSQVIHYNYDAYGNVIDQFEPEIRTHITYDPGKSKVIRIEKGYGDSALARTTEYEYTENGVALKRTKDVQNDRVIEYEYDNVGRRTKVKEISGNSDIRESMTDYIDEYQRISAKSDLHVPGDGLLQTITHYDHMGRVQLVQQTDGAPLGGASSGILQETQYEYPANNGGSYEWSGRRVISSSPYREYGDSTLEWACTQYDNLGRITRMGKYRGPTAPVGCDSTTGLTGLQQIIYDSEWTTYIDPVGSTRKERRDALGRLIQVLEDPNGLNHSTTYGYDVMDNLTQVTQGSQVRTFTYSSLGRLLTAANPENGQTQYEYYDNGDLKKKTDAMGKWVSMTYDALHRIKTKSYSDSTPSVSYEYHLAGSSLSPNIGKLKSVGSSKATTSYEYDAAGNIAYSWNLLDGYPGYLEFGYEWYLNGAMKSMVYPSGRIVHYSVDDAGRTNKVRSGALAYADLTAPEISNPYTADGRIAQMKLGNGRYETHDYHTPGTPTVFKLGVAVGDGSLTQIEYDFQSTTNNGNVWKQRILRSQLSLEQEYAYDALNRISSLNESSAVNRTYGYDRYGNRYVSTSSSQIPSPIAPEPTLPGHFNTTNNRLAMSGTGFDAAGNQTTLDPFTLEYDAEGRNTVVKLSGTPYVTFSYDGEGRRVKKVMNGGDTTYYVYDATGQLAVEYSTETPSSTGPSYMFTDMLGSVRTITSNAGAVVECYDYLPFGRMLGFGTGGRGTCYPTSPDANYDSRSPQKFTGKERDAETGLDYFLARYYSGAQGRFISPDEWKGGPDDALTGKDIIPPGPLPYADIANPQTLNKYAYVLNNPLRYTDPDGHCAWDICIGEAIATTAFVAYLVSPPGQKAMRDFADATVILAKAAGEAIGGLISKSETKPESKTSDGSTSQDKTESKVNTNPYAGSVDKPVTVVDPQGNAIPVGEGQRINSSPKGDYQQVLGKNGEPTGDRLDAGGHKKQTNPRAQGPHAHRPKVRNEDGDPHLPID